MLILAEAVLLDGSVPLSGEQLKQTAQRIYVPRGTDLTIRVTFKHQDGSPLDLTGGAYSLGLRQDGTDPQAFFVRPGVPFGDPADGIADFPIVQADTLPLLPGGFFWDVHYTNPGGDRDQVIPFSPWVLTSGAALPTDPLSSPDPSAIIAYPMPDQTGHDGEFLRTFGGVLDWEAVSGSNPPPIGTVGAVDIEDPAGTLTRRRATYDDIDPAFSIASFSPGFGLTKELGDTISNPSFTASYANPTVPASATLDETDTPGQISLLTPFASFAYGTAPLPARSYSKSALNATVTWTLRAKKTPTATALLATIAAAWRARAFWGHAVPATLNEAFIEALSDSRLQASYGAGSYPFTAPGAGRKLYIALPTGLASPTSWKDQNNDAFPMTKVATAVAVTNSFSVLVPGGYDVWTSDNFITSAFTLTGVP